MYWKNGSWELSGDTMGATLTAKQEFVCLIYSDDLVNETLCSANDAVILETDVSGFDVKFLLQSPSGLYFEFGVDGEFQYVGNALRAACEKYKIPCELPDSPYWGISVDSLFGLEMTSTTPYTWWIQTTFNSATGKWVRNNLGIGNYPTEALNGEYFGLRYGGYYASPTVTPSNWHPIYNDTISFLIQDGSGVYFWIAGEGNTVLAAFEDAADAYGIPYTLRSGSVSSMFGIEASDGKSWNTLYMRNGNWTLPKTAMSNMLPSAMEYVCIVFSADPANETLCCVSDAVILETDVSGSDVKFLLQSPSGLYFEFGVDGEFEFVGNALRAACEKYKIPCELPDSPYWGISVDSLFGLEMTSTPPYVWWVQSTFNSATGKWVRNNLGIGNYPTEDLNGEFFCLSYGGNPTYTPSSWNPIENEAITFLIQDGDGVYFWIAGEGSTVLEAFEDAADAYGIPYTVGSGSVSSIFGIGAAGGKTWNTLYMRNGNWALSKAVMSSMLPSAMEYVCIVFSADPANETLCCVSDAVILETDVSGFDVKFLLQSPSGLYFEFGVDGEFESVGNALRAACEKYNIPCDLPDSPILGISVDSLFGLGAPYVLWGQSVFDSSAEMWAAYDLGIGNYLVEDLNGEFFGLKGSYSSPGVKPRN
jgi:hypothetical protein